MSVILKIFVTLTIIIIIIILLNWFLPKIGLKQKIILPIIISVVSLIVSLIAAFKSEFLNFNLSIINDEVIISTPDKKPENISLIVPISFVNEGYGNGIIEWIAIKIIKEADDNIKLYTPIAEIDLQEFIQGKRKLHASNIKTGFSSFILSSKEAMKKHILFTQELDNKEYPLSAWEPGKYKFEIYVKINNIEKPKLLKSQTFEFTEEQFKDCLSGKTQYRMMREIKL